jgi:hypothetical protein
MAAWGASMMENSWTSKGAVAAAEAASALDAIDMNSGWVGL